MTEKKRNTKKRASAAFELVFCSISALALLLTFFYSEISLESMSKGMTLCVYTVIPSLFPFMVLSDIFVASGASDLASRIFGRVIARIFRVRRECAPAVLLGLMFGFPIGTRCALSLYDRGTIEKRELEHLLVFCNGPSSAFLIGAVGSSLFASKKFGILLCVAEIVSALAVAILARGYFGGATEEKEFSKSAKIYKTRNKKGAVGAIVDAVSGSAQGMINICAFVIFFSAFVGVIEEFFVKWGISKVLRAVIFAFFELSGGVSKASALSGYAAYLICAAGVGWSGLSVHFQFISLCSKYEISYKPYFVAKVLRALLDTAIVAGVMVFFGDTLDIVNSKIPPNVQNVPPTVSSSILFFGIPQPIVTLTFATFIFGILAAYRRVKSRGR